jgi:hypothetical protein
MGPEWAEKSEIFDGSPFIFMCVLSPIADVWVLVIEEVYEIFGPHVVFCKIYI